MHIKVRAKASARKEELQRVSDAHFEVSVRAKPVQNMANKRIAELLAAHFGVPVGKVRIVKGHRSPSKIYSVDI